MSVVHGQHAALTSAMWAWIASESTVSPARVINIYFDKESDDEEVDVWFTILDASGVDGT